MGIVFTVLALLCGFCLSIYAGVIVARYMRFDTMLDEARSLIFNLEQNWKYYHLDREIVDPDSPSGHRTVFFSQVLSSNWLSWRLTEVGLRLKELGHWQCGLEMDKIGMEVDDLRADFLSKANLSVRGARRNVLPYIADWHRRLSSLKPKMWSILKPWPNLKYRHLSCISVDEETGQWAELEPERRKTALNGLPKEPKQAE